MKRLWFWTIPVVVLLSLALMQPLAAQQANMPRPVTADEVNEVARQIWCPLCSGVRLDSCELKACEQMRQEIAIKLEAGEDAEAIKAYFLEQYGPQTLGEPPREGFNWLAWILPVVAVAGGAIFLAVRGRSLFVGATQTTAASPPQAADDDPLAHKLDEELKRYG